MCTMLLLSHMHPNLPEQGTISAQRTAAPEDTPCIEATRKVGTSQARFMNSVSSAESHSLLKQNAFNNPGHKEIFQNMI